MPHLRLSGAGLALMLLTAASCAPQSVRVDPEPAPVETVDVLLDVSVQDLEPPQASAWHLYGVLKAKLIEQRAGARDDYWVEVGSRTGLATYWDEEGRKKAGASDPYLDALVEVQKAGHIPEYVLAALARPGWTIPGDVLDDLDLAGFRAWSREKLAGHKVETRAAVARAGSDLSPAVPGDDLPTLQELATSAAPCAQLARASAAYTAWRERERQLPGIALGSRDRGGFIAALALLQQTGTARGRDVTWVSPRAADLSYLVGFCEVDRNQRAASVDALETAVRLDPLTPMWRLELVGSLTAAKRFDDAEREVRLAIAQSDDACTLGGAWRKKGFLEIERGQLEQAELSYRKSLEYEPGNAIALSELKVILRERMQKGDGPPAPYEPPPSTAPIPSRCPGR